MDCFDINRLIQTLNPVQKEIVMAPERPTLVLAGAGSGKTRVLTTRIAYLAAKGVNPRGVLAITFTNKAAREMRERLTDMLGIGVGGEVTASTFHSFGLWFLRSFAGLRPGILDDADQTRLLKKLVGAANVQDKRIDSGLIAQVLAKMKDSMLTFEQAIESINPFLAKTRGLALFEVIKAYEAYLKKENLADFGDLLLRPVRLLEQDPGILEQARRRFSHVFVDEFQDINFTQYRLLKLLCQPNRPLFAVGDDDQSIYGWRGANLASILRFEEDFSEPQVFRLEQNYRSTRVILEAANGVIKKNNFRRGKTLWTENTKGSPIQLIEASNEFEEGRMAAEAIQRLISDGKDPGDIAILYRTNAQSRALEEALLGVGIPYLILGGVKFYQRREIKDLLAYLKFLANPCDTLSLYRLAQNPPKGIGEVTLQKLSDLKERVGHDYLTLLTTEMLLSPLKSQAKKLLALGKKLQEMNEGIKNASSLSDGLLCVVNESGLEAALLSKPEREAKERVENLYEMVALARSLEATQGTMELQDYLDHVSLMTDLDQAGSRTGQVLLMTLHQAKGLEFPFVFLVGLEDSLLPHSLCRDLPNQIEEERRLFYVGVTRAKERLFLSLCRYRFGPMGKEPREPSPFLGDIPRELIERVSSPNEGWLSSIVGSSQFSRQTHRG
jgi:DNA helicase-2/ATP-dependent DNA helicase PcrA